MSRARADRARRSPTRRSRASSGGSRRSAAGSDPGKARLVAALASQLVGDAPDAGRAGRLNAEIERIVVELETVRGRVLADEADAAARLAALQDELTTVAARLAAAGGESTT